MRTVRQIERRCSDKLERYRINGCHLSLNENFTRIASPTQHYDVRGASIAQWIILLKGIHREGCFTDCSS
jgi:hypothetical protein